MKTQNCQAAEANTLLCPISSCSEFYGYCSDEKLDCESIMQMFFLQFNAGCREISRHIGRSMPLLLEGLFPQCQDRSPGFFHHQAPPFSVNFPLVLSNLFPPLYYYYLGTRNSISSETEIDLFNTLIRLTIHSS